MNCIECGMANLRPAVVRLKGTIRGQEYTIEMQGFKCPRCGYATIEGPRMAEFGRLLADKYRQDHGLLTSEEIRARRRSLGMNQQEFARHLGVGVASVKRWEMGKIQDQRSNECIIRKTEVQPRHMAGLVAAWSYGPIYMTDTNVFEPIQLVDVVSPEFESLEDTFPPHLASLLNRKGTEQYYG